MTSFVISTSGKSTIIKDPEAVLDYTVDWTAWLDEVDDTLISHVVIPEAGITCDSSNISGKTVVIWLSGGSANVSYIVTCEITTVLGRTDQRSFTVKVKER